MLYLTPSANQSHTSINPESSSYHVDLFAIQPRHSTLSSSTLTQFHPIPSPHRYNLQIAIGPVATDVLLLRNKLPSDMKNISFIIRLVPAC